MCIRDRSYTHSARRPVLTPRGCAVLVPGGWKRCAVGRHVLHAVSCLRALCGARAEIAYGTRVRHAMSSAEIGYAATRPSGPHSATHSSPGAAKSKPKRRSLCTICTGVRALCI
eukprot:3046826-Rhodomonas_salina.1